jgi:hypothetical protein
MKIVKLTKPLTFLILFYILLIIPSCGSLDEYASLRVVNQYSGRTIKSVSLVGYTFSHLSIETGKSQLFALDKGMPSGYSNINVSVGYSGGWSASWSISNDFDFVKGDVTTITLKSGTILE